MGLESYDTALIYYKKTIAASLLNNDTYSGTAAISNIANILIIQKKWDEAISYLDSIKYDRFVKLPLYNQKGIYNKYYNAYKSKNDLTTASLYLDSIEHINETIFNTKLDEKIAELEVSYSREERLQQKVKVTGTKLKKSEQLELWGLLIIGFLIITSIGVIVSLRFRSMRIDRDRIITEQKLLRSQMTPHFIFNSLAVIQGMILNKEETKASTYLSKFSKLMRLILENSRNKTVSLNDELQALTYYLDLQNIRFENRFTYTINLDPTIDQESLCIPPMIIQPFVENITEHAFSLQKKEGIITIDIQLYDNHIKCQIIDNGLGINAVKKAVSSQKKSLSTTITSERLQHLSRKFKANASVSIVDRSKFGEQGTIVTLNIPYKKITDD